MGLFNADPEFIDPVGTVCNTISKLMPRRMMGFAPDHPKDSRSRVERHGSLGSPGIRVG